MKVSYKHVYFELNGKRLNCWINPIYANADGQRVVAYHFCLGTFQFGPDMPLKFCPNPKVAIESQELRDIATFMERAMMAI